MRGLILYPLNTAISYPKSRPATVSSTKASKPRLRILIVARFRKLSALMVAPIVKPRNNVAY
jgi:hypothetical protein